MCCYGVIIDNLATIVGTPIFQSVLNALCTLRQYYILPQIVIQDT